MRPPNGQQSPKEKERTPHWNGKNKKVIKKNNQTRKDQKSPTKSNDTTIRELGCVVSYVRLIRLQLCVFC